MSRVLILIALRNLFAHKAKSLIVGSIIFFGTFLVVVGTAMLDSVSESMARSITSSLAGHMQIYSSEGRDELALFGGGFMGDDDFGEIRDFKQLREAVEALPNVKAVVPMGIVNTTTMSGNEIDQAVGAMRTAFHAHDDVAVGAQLVRLRNIARDLLAESKRTLDIAANRKKVEDRIVELERLESDAFEKELRAAPEKTLAYLESHIAPMASDGQMIYFRVVGTDLSRFSKLFDSFEIAKGEMAPDGQRGILIADKLYEDWIKNRVARQLDKLNTGRSKQAKTIAGDSNLGDIAKRLPRQYAGITYQLDGAGAVVVEKALREELSDTTSDLTALVQKFLTVDDATFDRRYEFFYRVIAPHLRLYIVPVGGTLTLRAVTKTGYFEAVNVKIWGTYRFKGLEDSDLAGAQNLVDMLSFRELYGVMTSDKQKELESIRAEVGAKSVSRDSAEAELFGGGGSLEQEVGKAQAFEVGQIAADSQMPTTFTAADVDDGLSISAAVLLNDATHIHDSVAAISAELGKRGWPMKVVDWQQAAGVVGQFILVLRLVLYIAIFIIFMVALVIINNSMLIATMERIAEIGTLRAIGAEKRFVMTMFLVETLTLGVLSGLCGAIAGAALVRWLGGTGIPAANDIMVFLFAGPRLFPSVGIANLVLGVVAILIVSLASTLYPARVATGIQPVVAMQSKE
jgi:ABC-type lipoprotein release transport system permease subunit